MNYKTCPIRVPLCLRPKHVFAPVVSPERRGYRMGLANLHYAPQLDYPTSEDWIAWLKGWRKGQAEYRKTHRWAA